MVRRPSLIMVLAAVFMIGLLAGCAPTPEFKEPPPPPPMPEKGVWMQGEAIWYGMMFHGRRTTSGESFDMRELTGAHATIPLGSQVEVTDVTGQKKVIITINDRTHLESGNDLAVSKAAAEALGVYPQRRFNVRYRWVQ